LAAASVPECCWRELDLYVCLRLSGMLKVFLSGEAPELVVGYFRENTGISMPVSVGNGKPGSRKGYRLPAAKWGEKYDSPNRRHRISQFREGSVRLMEAAIEYAHRHGRKSSDTGS
jgi:hypothetical protein